MRELFVEELESVHGGQPLPDPNDYIQSTMACCEESPFGCCSWWNILDGLDDIIVWP